MARGGRRPGAGRKPISLAVHTLRGTVRPDRHLAATAAVLRMPASSARDWRPTDAEIKPLSPLAQTCLHATLHLYQLDALEGQRLLEALRVLSRIEVLEATVGMTAAGALARERRLFQSMWAALDLRGDK
jgi:hypothetical protein